MEPRKLLSGLSVHKSLIVLFIPWRVGAARRAERPAFALVARISRARVRGGAERRVAPAERPAGAVDGDNGCHP